MRFFEYLFFKYYYFQVRVGNKEIAPFTAIVFIGFIFEFIYADIVCFYYFFVKTNSYNSFPSLSSFIMIPVIVTLLFCSIFFYKKRFKEILKVYDAEWKGKKNLGAILFAVVPFLLFFVQLFIALKFFP